MPEYKSPQDYESQITAERQEERIRQLQEEKNKQTGGTGQELKGALKGFRGGTTGIVKKLGKQELKTLTKMGAKSMGRLFLQFLAWIAPAIPYILIALLIIFIIIFILSCLDNKVSCAVDLGPVFFEEYINI